MNMSYFRRFMFFVNEIALKKMSDKTHEWWHLIAEAANVMALCNGNDNHCDSSRDRDIGAIDSP